jgi:hypothetical protein
LIEEYNVALIIAFRREDGGHWYGIAQDDPDIAAASRGWLRIEHRPPGEPGALCPFAGQRLEVLYISTEEDPGPVPYRLESGRQIYPTDNVYELLDCYVPPAELDHVEQPRVETPPVVPASPLALEVSDSHGTGELLIDPTTADSDHTGPLRLEVLGSTPDGERRTWLEGEAAQDDLTRIGRLFLAAAATQLPRVAGGALTTAPAFRRGTWYPEEVTLLCEMARRGAPASQIADALGRTESSVAYRLYQERLGPYPSNPSTTPRPPARPKTPPAYTMDDLRQEHRNSHMRWTVDDDQRLAERSRAGASVEELMAEFGRNHNAIVSRLGKVNAGHHTDEPPPAEEPPRADEGPPF